MFLRPTKPVKERSCWWTEIVQSLLRGVLQKVSLMWFFKYLIKIWIPSVFFVQSSFKSSRHLSLVVLFLHFGGIERARVIVYPRVSFLNKQSWIKYCNREFLPSKLSRISGNFKKMFFKNMKSPWRGMSSSLALISLISLFIMCSERALASWLTGWILWSSLCTSVLINTSFNRLKKVAVFSGFWTCRE